MSAFRFLLLPALLFALTAPAPELRANRITLITHGYNASVDEWIIPLANRMANYTSFWGERSSCYQLTVSTNSSGEFQVTSQFLEGAPAAASESGNIFIKLDWSNVAGEFNSPFDFYPAPYNVTTIAEAVAPALRDSSLISDLNGHAVAEFPLHLIGHSRGGPMVTELARLLGASGIWVDQVTTLDPHPCDPEDPLEGTLCPVNDMDALIYENVTFADNYWQDEAAPAVKPLGGAYNRHLAGLDNGYTGIGREHSNIHLWYHGTLDFTSPTTSDTQAPLTDGDRLTWYATGETNGIWAGYLYSTIGGGNRNSSDQPAGPGSPAIAGGLTGTRNSLPANDGSWPNVIRLKANNPDRFPFTSEPGLATREENVVYANDFLAVNLDYQSGQASSISYFLDPDANALGGNEIVIAIESLSATGTTTVSSLSRALSIESDTTANGLYYLGAEITSTSSGKTRILYAPQKIAVLEPLRLAVQPLSATESQLFVTGSAGYEAVIESTVALPVGWNEIGLNAFAGDPVGTPVTIENLIDTSTGTTFFQARYQKPTSE